MKIEEGMIDWLTVLKYLKGQTDGGFSLGPYMEYPSIKNCRFVMQFHWRGKSVHIDWRMVVNDHLVGWTILNPYGKGTPEISTLEAAKSFFGSHKGEVMFRADNPNVGRRAETKAKQPKEWVKAQGIVKPGGVGATRFEVGVLHIFNEGQVIFGAQKSYFHEYFIHSEKEGIFPINKWTRIIVRAVNVDQIDPVTKQKIRGTELIWRAMIPGDQEPYAISNRAMKKEWKAPKGYIPFPEEWAKGMFPEQYKKWEEWIKGTPKALEKNSKLVSQYIVQYLEYIGQIVVRGIPNTRWFLRMKEGGKIKSFYSNYDPTYYNDIAVIDEGNVDTKWFTYEGDIKPQTEYNPTKELTAKISIIDSGSVEIVEEKDKNGKIILNLKFDGKKLQGNYNLTQEEKEVSMYTFAKGIVTLSEATYALQKHDIEINGTLKSHIDLHISLGFEFNLYGNPILLKEGEEVKAILKDCPDTAEWMKIDKNNTKVMIGNLVTYVSPIENGNVSIIEYRPPFFVSMRFKGSELNGYYVYIVKEGIGKLKKEVLPHPLSQPAPPEKRNVEDEALMRIVEQEIKRNKKSKEDEELSIELKKKKLQLVEKWLEAQE